MSEHQGRRYRHGNQGVGSDTGFESRRSGKDRRNGYRHGNQGIGSDAGFEIRRGGRDYQNDHRHGTHNKHTRFRLEPYRLEKRHPGSPPWQDSKTDVPDGPPPYNARFPKRQPSKGQHSNKSHRSSPQPSSVPCDYIAKNFRGLFEACKHEVVARLETGGCHGGLPIVLQDGPILGSPRHYCGTDAEGDVIMCSCTSVFAETPECVKNAYLNSLAESMVLWRLLHDDAQRAEKSRRAKAEAFWN